MAKPPTVIDVHTHCYPPGYISLLKSRTKVPYIHQPADAGADPRLVILDSDDDPAIPKDKRGRPVDSSYSSWAEKLKFMSTHGIDISVVSLANPWLDFLPSETAQSMAQEINDELNRECEQQNGRGEKEKLYAFACLPLSAPAEQIQAEVVRLSSLSHVKGVILGSTGLGAGLDDPKMESVWEALAANSTMVFLHPHYGLPLDVFGGPEQVAKSGHVLPLALGFPLETTIAVTRMYMAGVFDRHPKLRMLLAHSGGTLPFLAGRIQSCVEHERVLDNNGGPNRGPKKSIWEVLNTNIYLDAVIYGEAGLRGALAAGGTDRLMFGTDHPFFPPLKNEEKWKSVESNLAAIEGVSGSDKQMAADVLGANAARVLGIKI